MIGGGEILRDYMSRNSIFRGFRVFTVEIDLPATIGAQRSGILQFPADRYFLWSSVLQFDNRQPASAQPAISNGTDQYNIAYSFGETGGRLMNSYTPFNLSFGINNQYIDFEEYMLFSEKETLKIEVENRVATTKRIIVMVQGTIYKVA